MSWTPAEKFSFYRERILENMRMVVHPEDDVRVLVVQCSWDKNGNYGPDKVSYQAMVVHTVRQTCKALPGRRSVLYFAKGKTVGDAAERLHGESSFSVALHLKHSSHELCSDVSFPKKNDSIQTHPGETPCTCYFCGFATVTENIYADMSKTSATATMQDETNIIRKRRSLPKTAPRSTASAAGADIDVEQVPKLTSTAGIFRLKKPQICGANNDVVCTHARVTVELFDAASDKVFDGGKRNEDNTRPPRNKLHDAVLRQLVQGAEDDSFSFAAILEESASSDTCGEEDNREEGFQMADGNTTGSCNGNKKRKASLISRGTGLWQPSKRLD